MEGDRHASCSDALVWCVNHHITENHSTVTRQVPYGQDALTEASATYRLVFSPNLEIARKPWAPLSLTEAGQGRPTNCDGDGSTGGTDLSCSLFIIRDKCDL